MREAAPFIGIGWTMVSSLGVGLAVGYWLDKKWGTEPTWLLVGGGFGILAGFYHFYRAVSGTRRPK